MYPSPRRPTPSNSLDASGTPFTLVGGRYGLTAHAPTWGSMTLQRRAGDGSTFVAVATFSSDGTQSVPLPAGSYRVNGTAAAGWSLDIVRQPGA